MTTLPRPVDKLGYIVGNEDYTVIEPSIEQITEQVLALNNQNRTWVSVYLPDQSINIRGGNAERVILTYFSGGMRNREWKTLISLNEQGDEKFIDIAVQHELDTVPLFTTITKEVALSVVLAFYRDRDLPPAPEGTEWEG